MKNTFTKEYMTANCGCYSTKHLEGLSFMKKDSISLLDIIKSKIPQKDKFWFLFRKCKLTKLQKQELAINLAEIVLPIYEIKYPDNKAPRLAIEAARNYLKGLIDLDTLIIARRAAAAAAFFAAAADAAAAAYAAYAADAAAYAAAAEAAAADAYAAAAYAAAADVYKKELDKCLLNFIEIN